VSPALRSHFADYASYHATPGNQACHCAGIPLIVFTLVALLTRAPLATVGGFTLTLAEAVVAVVTVWCLTLDAPLALAMLAATSLFAVVGRAVPGLLCVALFVLGWILQFVGHYVYEKKAPAFYKNLAHLLVGPLWIVAKATGRT
jgi:uncharacterized membrane protein YGL010W